MIINEYMPLVEKFKKEHKIEDEDFKKWHAAELKHLTDLANEPPEDVLKMAYLESLLDLKKKQ